MTYLEAHWPIENLLEQAESGNADAARLIHELSVETTRALYSLCVAHPEMAEAIKHKHPRTPWPLLHTDLKAREKGNLTVPKDHLLRTLGVIREVRTFEDSAPGTKAAAELYQIMASYRQGPRELTTKREREIQGLPALSESSLAEWWRLAQPLIAEWWGAEFQDHADFAGWQELEAQGAKYPRGVRRSRIKSGILQGLRSLASELR